MVTINFDTIKDDHKKIDGYKKQHNVSTFKILKVALERLIKIFIKKNKQVAYTYNPLEETARVKLAHFIEMNFKNKAEFAKEANLDLTVLSSLLVNRRCGNALTWKKINDAFEKRGVKLPCDLKIKYEVVDAF